MICVSLGGCAVDTCLDLLRSLDFAEIRLDMMDVSVSAVERIFSVSTPLIATCRPGRYDEETRKELLMAAIDAGARYVDLELESDRDYRQELLEYGHARKCEVIVSFHDYERTPQREQLTVLADSVFSAGADIGKIAAMAQTPSDSARLLGLLGMAEYAGRLVVVGMGEEGKITRIAAPFLGSPFAFASSSEEAKTACGQVPEEKLRRIMELIRYA
jgi:3-dehydroquinate dehydratase-1